MTSLLLVLLSAIQVFANSGATVSDPKTNRIYQVCEHLFTETHAYYFAVEYGGRKALIVGAGGETGSAERLPDFAKQLIASAKYVVSSAVMNLVDPSDSTLDPVNNFVRGRTFDVPKQLGGLGPVLRQYLLNAGKDPQLIDYMSPMAISLALMQVRAQHLVSPSEAEVEFGLGVQRAVATLVPPPTLEDMRAFSEILNTSAGVRRLAANAEVLPNVSNERLLADWVAELKTTTGVRKLLVTLNKAIDRGLKARSPKNSTVAEFGRFRDALLKTDPAERLIMVGQSKMLEDKLRYYLERFDRLLINLDPNMLVGEHGLLERLKRRNIKVEEINEETGWTWDR